MEHIARVNIPWDSYMGRYRGMHDPMPDIIKRGGENPQKCIEQLIEMWSAKARNYMSKQKYMSLLYSLSTEKVSDSHSINNQLNDDCLETIFDYLSNADKLAFETVCKRWREVALAGWRRITHLDLYKIPSDDTSPDSAKCRTNNQILGGILKKCGEHLYELKIGDPCDYNILSAVNQYCQTLTTLNISFIKFTTQDARMFPLMQNLKYLEIRGLKHYPKKLFEALPIDCLTELHLWTTGYGSLPLIAPTVLERCANLSAITLNGFAPDPNVLNVISQKTGLKSLSLSNCLLNVGLPSLTLLENLERLDLSWVSGVVECYIGQLSKYCKKLKYLDLTQCSSLDDEAIAHLAKLPQLEGLIVRRIPEITDAPLGNLRNLKELQCGYNSRIGNDGIIALLENAPHLRYLNLRRTAVTRKVFNQAQKMAENRSDNLPLCVVISRSVGVMNEVFSCLVTGVDNLVFDSQYLERRDQDNIYSGEVRDIPEWKLRLG